MNDLAKIALPASIALLGTLIGLGFAYRQSRRRGREDAEAAYGTDRRAAYKALWEHLEAVHAYARSLKVDQREFDTMVREVNLQVLRTEVYLESDERRLVDAYLRHLMELGTSAASLSSSPSAEREVYITGAPAVTPEGAEFLAVLQSVEKEREVLLQRFRAALTGRTVPPAA
jgi:hypothetical protein